MINPCFCCSAEAGVYILLFFNLLYFAGCVIFGVIFSAWTITVALEDSYPLGYRAVNLVIWITFVIYFAIETFLGSHLLSAVNRSDNATEFRHWVKIRVVVLLFVAPIVGLHAYIHYGILEIFVICVVTIYQIYYIWVVQYYAYELDIELESDSTGIGDGSVSRNASFYLLSTIIASCHETCGHGLSIKNKTGALSNRRTQETWVRDGDSQLMYQLKLLSELIHAYQKYQNTKSM